MTKNRVNVSQFFDRKALSHLKNWANKPDGERKPLILRGARQVGKSTLVKQFARNEGCHLFELNLEKNPNLQKIFEADLFDSIYSGLELFCRRHLDKDLNLEKSLLFIDEIQKSPRAIETLRYFFEDKPKLKVIAAGSLLDFTMSEAKLSVPVGRLEYAYLQPFTFTEFLNASGEKKLADWIQDFQLSSKINPAIHHELIKQYRTYFYVGGMPEAVKIWSKTKSPEKVNEVHQSILSTYRDDFGKYASGKELIRLQKLFEKFPAHLGRKIKYSKLATNEQSRDIRGAVELLCKAKVLNKVHHSNCSGLPLSAQEDEFTYKLYFLDIGLVCAALGLELRDLRPPEGGHEDRLYSLSEGALSEQVIYQNLKASYFNQETQIHYWLRESKSQNAELDFVISYRGRVIPIEVKSGKSGSLRSLQQFVADKKIKTALRFDLNPPAVQSVRHTVITPRGSQVVIFNLISLPAYLSEKTVQILDVKLE